MLTQSEVIKEIRATARSVGLTFRRANTRLNGVYLWELVDRKTQQVQIRYYQLGTAYNDTCSGYISSYCPDVREFVEI